MKKFIIAVVAAIAAIMTATARPASTRWDHNPQPHRHGIGYVCPHCGQTWGAIPPGLKAWEVRHLLSERKKFIALHMRVRHGAKK